MITRMEITYRSKEPCSIKPEIFTSGGYSITKDNAVLNFDFEDMTASCRYEGKYLFIDVIQKNLDESLLDGMSLELADRILRTAIKEDFMEVYSECFADSEETEAIKLIPMEIEFYDFSLEGDGLPIKILGDSFCNLTE